MAAMDADHAVSEIAEPELRAELLRRRDVEQEARFAFIDAKERGEHPDWAPVRMIDEDNLVFLVEVIGRHGWLGSDLVEVDGASACWLIVQHSPMEYQQRWLPLMERAVLDGLARPADLVYLQDRVNMGLRRRQTHGSQSWGHSDTTVKLWPVTDPASLNARRGAVDLPPLDEDVIANAWTADELGELRHPLDDATPPTFSAGS